MSSGVLYTRDEHQAGLQEGRMAEVDGSCTCFLCTSNFLSTCQCNAHAVPSLLYDLAD